jgi:hypothetical protein
LKKEEAPKWKVTQVPFSLKKMEAAKWLAWRARGVSEDKLAKELKEYQRQRKHHEMLVPITLTALNNGKMHAVKALFDNECTTTCINRDYAKAEGFELQELDAHITARNADRTENARGKITHYVEMIMTIGPHSERQRFLVTGLGKARVFIGYDWLYKHNPEIDWRSRKLVFSRCPPKCNMMGTEFRTGVQKEEAIEEGESILLVDFTEAIDLCLKETSAQKLAEEVNRGKEKMTEEKIREQYREFVKVFVRESFDSLPEKHLWDHAIELKPGSKAVDCKIYPLSVTEQGKLNDFLEENLKSGRIRLSKSPMASAFFFIKKKDGSLRPVQDYQKLNEMTIKNRYPLPLISELVNKLRSAKIFTKLDIRWGYNDVRIKEGDEWKVAFRTTSGKNHLVT